MFSFEDQTSSWTFVNYNEYHPGIVFFDEKASKVGENLWEITANEVLDFGRREFGLEELSGKSNGSHTVMHGTVSGSDLS